MIKEHCVLKNKWKCDTNIPRAYKSNIPILQNVLTRFKETKGVLLDIGLFVIDTRWNECTDTVHNHRQTLLVLIILKRRQNKSNADPGGTIFIQSDQNYGKYITFITLDEQNIKHEIPIHNIQKTHFNLIQCVVSKGKLEVDHNALKFILSSGQFLKGMFIFCI